LARARAGAPVVGGAGTSAFALLNTNQKYAIWIWSGVRSLGVVCPSPPRACNFVHVGGVFLAGDQVRRSGAELCGVVEYERVTSAHPGANAKGRSGVNRYSPSALPCG
jgi:hypothetical protein